MSPKCPKIPDFFSMYGFSYDALAAPELDNIFVAACCILSYVQHLMVAQEWLSTLLLVGDSLFDWKELSKRVKLEQMDPYYMGSPTRQTCRWVWNDLGVPGEYDVLVMQLF